MHAYKSLVALLIASVWSSTAVADTYVVQPDRQGDFPTIQVAIQNSSNGDVIELTNGIFAGDGNRELSFEGRAITIRSQSGNPEACIIDAEGTESEPRRVFRFINGEGPDSVIEGVTITGGWIGSPNCGGAMSLTSDSSPTIRNCRIVDNYGGCVGGIFIQWGSPVITECLFEGNSSAASGECGALFIGSNSSPTVARCRFFGNTAGTGAGVFLRFNATTVLVDCLFIGNTANRGGAVYCTNDAIVGFENCTLVENEATNSGGGILCNESTMVTLTNTIIASGPGGGAIVCEDFSTATLSCCDVWGNSGGDWEGCIADQSALNGNMSLDPCFCIYSYFIAETSPCAPANNSCGVLIGARDVSCVDCGGDVPTLETTWGQVKASYR